ncbi:MAG: hypothetical protein ACFFGZ_10250 [Candidatus Thorarchaeota archaeon]
MLEEPQSSKEGSHFRELPEGDKRLPQNVLTDEIQWALQKLIPIEQRLFSAGVFDLIEDLLVEQKIALFLLARNEPSQVKRQLLSLLAQGQEEPQVERTERDLTEVLVWALRELTLIVNRLSATGVLALVDDWLADFEMQLVLLLQKEPRQVRKPLQQKKRGKGDNMRLGNKD